MQTYQISDCENEFFKHSVQFSHSVMSDFVTHGLQHARLPWPSPTPRALLKLMSIESVMPSNHLILCRPLLLLLSIFPSIRVSSNESALHIRWPKYWSFSFSVSLSSEYLGLISFRMDYFGSPCSPRDSDESSPTPPTDHVPGAGEAFHSGQRS